MKDVLIILGSAIIGGIAAEIFVWRPHRKNKKRENIEQE